MKKRMRLHNSVIFVVLMVHFEKKRLSMRSRREGGLKYSLLYISILSEEKWASREGSIRSPCTLDRMPEDLTS